MRGAGKEDAEGNLSYKKKVLLFIVAGVVMSFMYGFCTTAV